MAGATLAEALAAQKLGEFEGKDERRAGVEIPSVAGGLRKAMKIQPRRMKQGERGYIAFEYVVEKIKHNPIDKDNPVGDQERVHVLAVEGVTFIDSELVKAEIDRQKEAVKKAELEAKGVHELPLDGESSTPGENTGDKPKRSRARGPRKPKETTE